MAEQVRRLFEADLKIGDKGDNVLFLQRWLIGYGYAIAALIPDGDFGKMTQRSVIQLQQFLGVSETGILDQTTKSALKISHGFDFDSIPV